MIPTRRRQLLAEAAAEDGFTLPLSTLADGTPLKLSYRDVVRPYQPQSNVIAADIQTQLAAIGINVQIDVQESATFLDNAAAGKLPLSMVGWIVDYTDATDWLDTHFGAGADDTFGDKIPELEDAIAQGGKLANPDARYPFYVDGEHARPRPRADGADCARR